jgi:hypothetical protein
MRLANNNIRVVDPETGKGLLVPRSSPLESTTGGASAGARDHATAADSVAARRLQRYDAATAITDDSDDDEGEGALNNNHPEAAAGTYDDMPALEFFDSGSEEEGRGAEESKGAEE